MKKNSLYFKLRETEELSLELCNSIGTYNEKVKEYEGFSGFEAPFVSQNEIIIDTPKVQRQLILKWIDGKQKNPILIDAVNGVRPIKQFLEELAEINKGWRRNMPRKKDTQHNQRVDYMNDLLGPSYFIESLEAEGLYSLGSPLNNALFYAGTLGLVIPIIANISHMLSPDVSASGHFAEYYPVYASLSSVGFLGAVGFLTGRIGRSSNKDLPWNRADYVDKKIQELI